LQVQQSHLRRACKEKSVAERFSFFPHPCFNAASPSGQILNHSLGHGRSRASKALWNESKTVGKPFIRKGF
jgi:hypothetical protein